MRSAGRLSIAVALAGGFICCSRPLVQRRVGVAATSQETFNAFFAQTRVVEAYREVESGNAARRGVEEVAVTFQRFQDFEQADLDLLSQQGGPGALL